MKDARQAPWRSEKANETECAAYFPEGPTCPTLR